MTQQETTHQPRWVLTFDGTCDRCRRIAAAVDEASRGRLEVLPLADEQVRGWREQALGPDARWAPTLIEVRADRVRGWIGPAIGPRLVTRLGPGNTFRVLRALGELRSRPDPSGERDTQAPREEAAEVGGAGIRRRGLLRLGTGVGVALGLVLTGRTPAIAAPDPGKLDAARAWARANQRPRPGQYDELGRFDVAYRQVIFRDLSPQVRSGLWREQLARYRRARSGLTERATEVLDAAEAVLDEPDLYTDPRPELLERLRTLEEEAIEALGRGEACRLLSVLGPREDSPTEAQPALECICHRGSACNIDPCYVCGCATTSVGCGCFYAWACNGHNCA